jgi:alkyl hydroperoxide reductase subunit F
VLIVGGGPAGAAAAVYAARKGIRTGVASERFGGQVLDTLGIENFISVKETEGPKFALALEEHVRDYDVDIMNLQRAKALVPGKDLIEVQLESGASLKSKTSSSPPARAGATSTCPASTSSRTRAWPTARTATARCSRASAWR